MKKLILDDDLIKKLLFIKNIDLKNIRRNINRIVWKKI